MNPDLFLEGNLVDLHQQKIYAARVTIQRDRISRIEPLQEGEKAGLPYLLPGFVDAHVHIESSMLVPSEFARLAVVHGTVGTVSDPHEIANVCGLKGVDYMISDGERVPFKFNFGAPSCVPATAFETAGAVINATDIEQLLQRDEIKYLTEMMNFPGVLQGDEEVMAKIAAAKKWNKPVDGHAPGLRGAEAKNYINAGISTDHECFTLEEALDKLQHGMKILIREGSAAKNFEALYPLLDTHPGEVMFCSDDKHPDSLVDGHINQLCARAVAKGAGIFSILRAACMNPVAHYGLKIGLLRENDFADLVLVRDLVNFEVLQTYINGVCVADKGKSKIINKSAAKEINHFHCEPLDPASIKVIDAGAATIPVIEALDGQLITKRLELQPKVIGNFIVADPSRDILKIIVVNRYQPAAPSVAFIKNFGIRAGAIASSVAHDSHNIVAIGTDDVLLCAAVNLLIKHKGGICSVDGNGREKVLPLPVAGLMSTDDGYTVARSYAALDATVKQMGTSLSAPFMTLSFMALLVIPHLKLSDKGLFDGDTFRLLDDFQLVQVIK